MGLSTTAIKITTEKMDKKGPDASLLRLYVPEEEPLPDTPTICCCSVQAWGWFVLVTNLLGFALKYVITGGDVDVDMIFELLTIPKWYDTLLIPFGIFNFLALVLFAVALIRRKSNYVVPYIAWQICLSVAQSLLAAVYAVIILTKNQKSIENTVVRCIIGFFTFEGLSERYFLALDDVTQAWFVVIGVFTQAITNALFAYLAVKLYKLYNYTPAHNRFRL